MFALNKFIATSQHYFVAPMPCEVQAATANTAATAAPAKPSSSTGFASQPQAPMLEQLTMAALVVLSGLTLANLILVA